MAALIVGPVMVVVDAARSIVADVDLMLAVAGRLAVVAIAVAGIVLATGLARGGS